MKTSIFAIFDTKASAFGQPFFMVASGLAIRSFTEASLNPDSEFNKYPRDFILNEIGEYDDETAKISSFTPMEICSAHTAIEQHRKNIRKQQNVSDQAPSKASTQSDDVPLSVGESEYNGALI